MKKLLYLFMAVLFLFGLPMTASASYYTGGDAASQAVATDILDIVFAFDTSGSMEDEIIGINSVIQNVISNLDCPECDVWVRATLMGITRDYSGIFGGDCVSKYVSDQGGAPVSNNLEDNGPAVTDLVEWYAWNNDAVGDQKYYKAIVSVGDEGTEDGYPAIQSDWDAAYIANQAAIDDDIMVFSLVGTPYPGYVGDKANRDAVFLAMAEGGSGGGYTFSDTGGLFVETTSNSIEQDLENIICRSVDPDKVPEPGTILLLGMGLLGLSGFGRGRIRRK